MTNRRRFLALLPILIYLAGCNLSPSGESLNPPTLSAGWQLQDAAKVSDSGDAISQPNYTPSNWYKATVPGTVLTSLVNDGVYPEPLYGENNRPDKIPDSLCRTTYWYRTQFTAPPTRAGDHIWLNLEGINYRAEIWVNGKQPGRIDGAFSRGIFDVTGLVKAGDTAGLAVHILPPPHPGTPLEQTVANGTGRNGGILTEDGATFLCTLGWDWIPGIRDRDMGIWQNVSISTTGPVAIADPAVSSNLPLPRTDVAELTLEATLKNLTDASQSGELVGVYDGSQFHVPVTLNAGETRVLRLTSADVPQLHVTNPKLWWPNGYGPQNLSHMHLDFFIRGAKSDSRDLTFGIRKITYQVPGSDNLTISVNGVPIMCKGGDWGMDEAMKRSPRARLEAQIRMHQLANYTMIRNWVGQSTSEDFYDLCDQYGILIWDEFFQPNPSDGPTMLDTQMYLANVREKVLRFRGHPSIALWCGRNEGKPTPPLVDQGIGKITAELDPSRLYQPSSTDGRGVRSGGPYSWRTPRSYYTFPGTEAFKTELGSVSIPTLEAIHGMMPQKDWWPINDDWAEHDLCRGAQEGQSRPPVMYPDMLAQRYGPVSDLPDFVRKGQLANYEAYRALYEGRFAKMFKPCSGVLTWMSNPAQPSFVWQLYSYDLEPNASLFATRRACEPVHIQMNQSDFHVMVINNHPAAMENLTARVRVFNLDGSLKFEHLTPLAAAPEAATDAGLIAFPTDLTPVHFVKVELRDSTGQLISDNFYWRAAPDHPDDFAALNTLPNVALNMTVSRADHEGKCLLNVKLSNPTQSIALMAHLQLRRKASGLRVLPVYYSDNYLSLLPGESRTISIEAAAKDLGGEEPVVALDGWNVTSRI